MIQVIQAINFGRIFNTLMQSIAALLTSTIAVFLLWCGFQVFADYGITLGIVIHCTAVIVIMALAMYLIYYSWNQVLEVAKGKPLK